MKIAQVIKTYRKKKGLTQQEFSQYFKVSIRTLSRWESGEVQPSNVYMDMLKERKII
jgi:DNA-binding transcriptional regulator YiaG